MNPLVALLGARALKFILASPSLVRGFAAEVKRWKAERPSASDIAELPDDAAAIKAFADRIDESIAENAAIQARLRARAARSGD